MCVCARVCTVRVRGCDCARACVQFGYKLTVYTYTQLSLTYLVYVCVRAGADPPHHEPPAHVPGVCACVQIRPIMNLALTYDHRLIDGREAVTFLKKIKDVVEDPRRLLLDV